jgi:non-homologous end joining protein Ku
LIQLKVDGQEIVQVSDPEEPKIINLMEALKQSVAAAMAAGGTKKRSPSSVGAKQAASDKKKLG